MKAKDPPAFASQCEDGAIVRTPVGVLLISWRMPGSLPCVRLLDPTSLIPISDPFALRVDVAALEVLRDQSSFYKGPNADTSGEVDPLKKR